MTSIDSTVIPELLSEEALDAVIEDGETYVSKLSKPKLVFLTPTYADTTVIPSASINGRTITFSLTDASDGASSGPIGYSVLILGRK